MPKVKDHVAAIDSAARKYRAARKAPTRHAGEPTTGEVGIIASKERQLLKAVSALIGKAVKV
jgi:hypothetical protein